ncbi:MAG TPA: hypothetical protein VMZ53_16420 [Kofleriaceae bacterium]|nr:hypothetical protein [Kofleriaceae bacterium]
MYADAIKVREAREQYFIANGFSDATYREDWARIKLGPVPVVFPNTKSRKEALPIHDLHHIATGYSTTIEGEGEIAAFEIGGGCGRYAAAWLINAGGFALGLVTNPRKIFRAFVRGRHSRNLYREGFRDSLLDLSVAELRKRVGTDTATPVATGQDKLAFVAWCFAVSWPVSLAMLAVGVVLAR